MSNLNTILNNVKQGRSIRKDLATQMLALKNTAKNTNDSSLPKTTTQEPGVTTPLQDTKAGIELHTNTIKDILKDLYKKTPQELVEELSDNNPILLFPVKIETKFKTLVSGKTELWVRIFPDDIAIHTHEELLTETEYANGKNYWASVFTATDDTTKQGAWNTLVAISGANRAAWIIKETKPGNWDSSPANVDALVFPVQTAFKSGSWTQAPHSKIMPDKFVVTCYDGTNPVFEKTGNLIPDDLQMAPDPSSEEAQLSRDAASGDIKVHDTLAWLFDFEKAETAGMAVRIELTEPYAAKGFDRIVVLGLRVSTGAEDSSLLIEELIDNHHYSLNGLSFLQQGTPTNNTEDDASGYDSTDFANETSYEIETGVPLFTVTIDDAEKTDGQLFAEALAIQYDPLYHVTNSNLTDIKEAVLMNTVLWPGTLGYFMTEMMFPVFTEDRIEFTRDFFTAYVSGRGSLPAIRVGNQPYGILVTSSFPKWKWSDTETGKNSSYYAELYTLLSKLQTSWKQLVENVNYAGKAGDPFSILLNIIGLQAGSVDFYQRIGTDDAYTWNYLNYQNHAIALQWNTVFTQYRNSLLTDLGLSETDPPKIAGISFLGTQNQLTGALVDDEKDLSETESITPFDATNNYINWLLASDTETITNQLFKDADGATIAAPKALLYLALRNAYLQQVWLNVDTLYKQNSLITTSYKDQSIVNVVSQTSFTKMDYLFADVSKILPPAITGNKSMIAADFVIQPEVISMLGDLFLVTMKSALEKLAPLPTARLERLFTEHLDLCSYRLDAWQTALFNKRLETLRSSAVVEGQTNAKGTFIGAFGWLEDIRPNIASKTVVTENNLPEKLRDTGKGKIVEDADNGGYIHGFTLNHALTGAVLRSAYLAHADDSNADLMSVNLSSERVRTAMYYLDGVRNGQTLSSLLGYQFERGLHDNNESLELDQYIYNIREKYPLISSELSNADDESETIAASNVVDGYALLEASKTKAYPYDVSGLPASTSSEGKAIIAEIDILADAMDSIGDLALGESVYQIVQGNYERGGSVLKSFSESKNPIDPQIVTTPGKGDMITNRIALNLEADPADNVWGTRITPAATVEKGLNKWLAGIIPDPTKIRCIVSCTHTDAETETEVETRKEITLASLDIQPLDFVLLVDKSFGNGSSEIEKRIACQFKSDEADTFMIDSIPVTIQFRERDTSWDDSIIGFFEIIPLVKSLRDIITQSRPLNALDLNLPAEAQVTASDNSKGYDTDDIKNSSSNGRLDIAYTSLENLNGLLTDAMAAVTEPYTWTAFQNWREALRNIADCGIMEAFPYSYAGYTATEYSILQVQTLTVQAGIVDKLSRAKTLLDAVASEATLSDAPTDAELMQDASRKKEELVANYTAAAKILLGASFNLIPKFILSNATDITTAKDNSDNLLRYSTNDKGIPFIAKEWLQGIAKVRKRAANLDEAMMYAQNIYQTDTTLTPIQLPYNSNHHWVAVEYPEEMKIELDIVSITAIFPDGYAATAKQSGLLIDEWTELIPGKKETTGIAFHYDQPNAMPPQALLLAVTPEIKGNWTWQDLMDIVNDTLDRAKLRAVEPDQIDGSAYAQLLPALMTAFSSSPVTISTYWSQNITGNILINPIRK